MYQQFALRQYEGFVSSPAKIKKVSFEQDKFILIVAKLQQKVNHQTDDKKCDEHSGEHNVSIFG